MALHHAGLMERRSGRDEDAARSFAEAIEVWKPMADEDPALPLLQGALSHEYSCLAACQRSLGRADQAERSSLLARGVIERLPDRGGNNLFALACVRARLAAMAGETGSLTTAEDQAERRRQVELAMDALRGAVAAGFHDVVSFRTSADLAPLATTPSSRSWSTGSRSPRRPGRTPGSRCPGGRSLATDLVPRAPNACRKSAGRHWLPWPLRRESSVGGSSAPDRVRARPTDRPIAYSPRPGPDRADRSPAEPAPTADRSGISFLRRELCSRPVRTGSETSPAAGPKLGGRRVSPSVRQPIVICSRTGLVFRIRRLLALDSSGPV